MGCWHGEVFESRRWTSRNSIASPTSSTKYADLPLGGTDTSLVVFMERFVQRRIATLNRYHFSLKADRSRSA